MPQAYWLCRVRPLRYFSNTADKSDIKWVVRILPKDKRVGPTRVGGRSPDANDYCLYKASIQFGRKHHGGCLRAQHMEIIMTPVVKSLVFGTIIASTSLSVNPTHAQTGTYVYNYFGAAITEVKVSCAGRGDPDKRPRAFFSGNLLFKLFFCSRSLFPKKSLAMISDTWTLRRSYQPIMCPAV
jgi:hypothetical protein